MTEEEAQHAGTVPGIPSVPSSPTIINQQVQSRTAGGDGVDDRYVELYREKITTETRLRILEGENEAIKREQDSIKGYLKAVMTSGRSTETKAFNAFKEEKGALENKIEEQERAPCSAAAETPHAASLPDVPPLRAISTIIIQQVQSRAAGGDGVDAR
ncbi:hypothetical protein CF326_g8559, partial [Tilletia indica]